MKACPKCGRLYPADSGFCPVDGGQLVSASQFPVPPRSDDPRVGDTIKERYQIRRVIADGGMGRVYEALDLVERRNVAVKILHTDVAKDPVQVERFKREFEVSKQLNHEHIIHVLDFFELPGGVYVMVMEFLFGEELAQLLAREKFLSPERIVRMLSQLAVGLDDAHKRQLVHRDLKPDNIFLVQTREGDIVKVLDFGSVKDRGMGAKQLTVMGTTIGSPYYMAPEQAQALDTLDHRADVWALAAIVYECMTGNVPFPGINGPQILLNILAKEAAPASLTKDTKYSIPPSIDQVLEKAFKKLPTLRYETVGAFADALGRAYGLTGDHQLWANTSESKLHKLIAGELRQLMSAPRSHAPRSAMDRFFGEQDSLGETGAERDSMADAMRSADDGARADQGGGEKPHGRSDYASFIPPASSVFPVWILVVVALLLAGALGFFLVF